MSGQRRRSKRKLRSDVEYDAVIILSRSDDEEASRDLSLEIVEKARKREATRKQAEEKPRASAQLPVIDLSSASSDDVEAAPPPEAEPSAKKSKKKKKKKKAAAENMKMNRQPLVKPSMSSSSPVEPCSDIVPPTNKQHQQLGMSGMPPSNHANAPFASTSRTITGRLTPKRHKSSDGFSMHQTTAANHQPSHYCASPTETMNGDAGKSTYKEMTNRDWAGLTAEPLFCILERLPIKDYIRFGSVCLSWYQTVATKLVSPAPHPPLLIVDPPEGSTTHLIFNPFSNKVEFRLQGPSHLVPLSITTAGYTAGYIMYEHITTSELVVKNPLTGSCLPFPSVTTLPPLPPEVPDIYISRAAALLSGSTITAVAIAYGYGYGYDHKALAFARLGDSNWTFFGDSVSVNSMIFHKGLLYVLTTDGRILTWDPWLLPAPLLTLSTHSLAANCSVVHWPNYSLVESSTGGDLLQVVDSRIVYSQRCGEPRVYKVFKLDPAGTSGPKWCMMTSLCGEDALMLSLRGAVCISTRDFPELRQNCIYSTVYHEPEDALDVFDLGEGKVVDYLPLPEEGYGGFRDWFIPSLD